MASAVPLEDMEEALATCNVCQEPFDADSRVPLTLTPCRHVFCRVCVTTLARAGIVLCPNCRTAVNLGHKGVEGLSKDRVTMNAVDYISMKRKMQTSKISCTDCPDGAKAVFRCHTCRTHLCTKCHDAHTRTTVTRNHQIVDLRVFMENVENFVKEKEACPTHPDKDIEVYCRSCSVSVCSLCSTVEHRSHDVSYFEEVHKQTINENESLKDEISQKVLHISQLVGKQCKILDTVTTTAENVKRDIQIQFTRMKSFLDQRQRKLSQTCDDMQKPVLTIAKQVLDRLETRKAQLEERKTTLKKIKEMTRPTQLVSVQREVSREVRTLLSLPDPPLHQPRGLHFHSVGYNAVTAAIKSMGDVTKEGESPVRPPIHVDLEQLLRFQGNKTTRFDLDENTFVVAASAKNGDPVVYMGMFNTNQTDITMIHCTKMELSEKDLKTSKCHMPDSTVLESQPSPMSASGSLHSDLRSSAYPGTVGTVALEPEIGAYFECHLSTMLVEGKSTDHEIAEIAFSLLTHVSNTPMCQAKRWGIEFSMSRDQTGRMCVTGMSRGTRLHHATVSDVPMRVDVVTKAELGLLLRNHILTVFDAARHHPLFQMHVEYIGERPWFGLFHSDRFRSQMRLVSGEDVKFDARKLQMLSSIF